MYELYAVVREKAGIHCRPSSVIVLAAQEFRGNTIRVEGNGMECDLQGVLDLLVMGLQQGDTVKIQVTGPRERECCEKLAGLFSHEFGFRE